MDTSIELVIPARGLSRWLSSSMQSIADQSLAPTCITLVNDGVDDARSVEKLGKDLFGERFQLLEMTATGFLPP